MSEEKRPEWMSSISGIVDPDEYLLGRKIDKTFELSQLEKAEKVREARIDLIAKDRLRLVGDPVLDIERRKEELKLEIISNPVKLRQLREHLLREEERGKQSQTSRTDVKPVDERPTTTDVPSSSRGDSSHRHRRHHRSPSTSSSESSASSDSRSRRHRSEKSRRERRRSPESRHSDRHNRHHRDEGSRISKRNSSSRSNRHSSSNRHRESRRRRSHDRHSRHLRHSDHRNEKR